MLSSQHGYLEVILGSMFAGKTSRLVEVYKQCLLCGIPVVVINHSFDTRYQDQAQEATKTETTNTKTETNTNTETENEAKVEEIKQLASAARMVTHDFKSIPCVACARLMPLIQSNTPVLQEAAVILINEGQFFDDLREFVDDRLRARKQLYVCGLDGDFERRRFGHMLDLIPLCDKVTKLTSLCVRCKDGTPGIFSKRITTDTTQTVIGGHDVYIPVCRRCYG